MQHYINSVYAESGTPTDFIYKMSIPPGHNRISLISASIPKSMYLFNDVDSRDIQLGLTTYTIPVGYYDVTSLVAELNTLTSHPGLFTFSARTGKISITSISDGYVFVTSKVAKILGLPVGLSFLVLFPGGEFPYPVNLTLLYSIYIFCNVVSDPSVTSWSSCLSHFYVNSSADSSYIQFYNPAPRESSKQLITYSPADSRQIYRDVHFTFVDDSANTIDLNGIPVDFVLWSFYEPEPLYNLVDKYIQYRIAYDKEQRYLAQQAQASQP